MLAITLSETESEPTLTLNLEHSLVSLSKWESTFKKPFYAPRSEKTTEEMEAYIQMMVVGDPAPEDFIKRLSREQVEQIGAYLNDSLTATWFPQEPTNQRGSGEVVTTELVYYWMISFRIPIDPCEAWHFSRLMTLIKIAGIKQTKPKKMTQQQIMERNRALNAQRQRELGTTG